MRRDELQELIQGAIFALPAPFDDEFRVDNGRMYELCKWLVSQGLSTGNSALKVASVAGEGPMLGDNEWPSLLRTVVQAVDGKVPVMLGINHKDTFRSIEDARKAQDLGAVGLQVSPPIFNDPSQDDMLRYFEALSDAIEIGVMVYNTPWYSSYWQGDLRSLGNVLPDTFVRMADFEHIVAVKWSCPEDVAYEDMKKFSHIFNVLDNNTDAILCHKLGGRGYIGGHEEYPQHDLRFWELLESRQYDDAKKLHDSIRTPDLAALFARVAKRSGGIGQLKKGMMEAMGWPMGPPRPPSLPLSAEELAELREIVRGWGWPVPEAGRKAPVAA